MPGNFPPCRTILRFDPDFFPSLPFSSFIIIIITQLTALPQLHMPPPRTKSEPQLQQWDPHFDTFTLCFHQTLGPVSLIWATQIFGKLLLKFTVGLHFLAVIKPSCLVASNSTILLSLPIRELRLLSYLLLHI